MAARAARSTPLQPRACDHKDCRTRIILAVRADTRRWVPYEAESRDPDTLAATGCHVLVGVQAWKPGDLVEHFRVQYETSTDRARDLVRDYPHHRPHFHATDEETNP